MKLKALILDFGGVVIKTPFELLEPLERRLGIARGSLDWHGPFAPERDARWGRMQRDEISERDYWALRAEEAGNVAGAATPWSTNDLMHEMYACGEAEFARPEAIEAMRVVRDAGLAVAVLTNDLAAFHGPAWFPSLALSSFIDVVVDASVTGILKPEPEAYAEVLLRLGLSREEALFVDDQARNVDGAERFGLRASQFDVLQPAKSFACVLAAFDLRMDEPVSVRA